MHISRSFIVLVVSLSFFKQVFSAILLKKFKVKLSNINSDRYKEHLHKIAQLENNDGFSYFFYLLMHRSLSPLFEES